MKIKRVIAVACAVAMLVSDVPSAVYAAEVTESTQMTESTQTAGNNLEDEPAESETTVTDSETETEKSAGTEQMPEAETVTETVVETEETESVPEEAAETEIASESESEEETEAETEEVAVEADTQEESASYPYVVYDVYDEQPHERENGVVEEGEDLYFEEISIEGYEYISCSDNTDISGVTSADVGGSGKIEIYFYYKRTTPYTVRVYDVYDGREHLRTETEVYEGEEIDYNAKRLNGYLCAKTQNSYIDEVTASYADENGIINVKFYYEAIGSQKYKIEVHDIFGRSDELRETYTAYTGDTVKYSSIKKEGYVSIETDELELEVSSAYAEDDGVIRVRFYYEAVKEYTVKVYDKFETGTDDDDNIQYKTEERTYTVKTGEDLHVEPKNVEGYRCNNPENGNISKVKSEDAEENGIITINLYYEECVTYQVKIYDVYDETEHLRESIYVAENDDLYYKPKKIKGGYVCYKRKNNEIENVSASDADDDGIIKVYFYYRKEKYYPVKIYDVYDGEENLREEDEVIAGDDAEYEKINIAGYALVKSENNDIYGASDEDTVDGVINVKFYYEKIASYTVFVYDVYGGQEHERTHTTKKTGDRVYYSSLDMKGYRYVNDSETNGINLESKYADKNGVVKIYIYYEEAVTYTAELYVVLNGTEHLEKTRYVYDGDYLEWDGYFDPYDYADENDCVYSNISENTYVDEITASAADKNGVIKSKYYFEKDASYPLEIYDVYGGSNHLRTKTTVKTGDSYSYEPIKIDGYTSLDDSTVSDSFVRADDTEKDGVIRIYFYYEGRIQYTVKVYDNYGSKRILRETSTVYTGEHLSYSGEPKDGYFTASTSNDDIECVTGNYADEDNNKVITVEFWYEEIKTWPVEIYDVIAGEKKLRETMNITNADCLDENSIDVDGYDCVRSVNSYLDGYEMEESADEDGVIRVMFYYETSEPFEVEVYDIYDGTEHLRQTENLNPGDYDWYEANQNILGYNPSQKSQDDVRIYALSENADENRVIRVNFYYDPVTVYTIEVYDVYDGNETLRETKKVNSGRYVWLYSEPKDGYYTYDKKNTTGLTDQMQADENHVIKAYFYYKLKETYTVRVADVYDGKTFWRDDTTAVSGDYIYIKALSEILDNGYYCENRSYNAVAGILNPDYADEVDEVNKTVTYYFSYKKGDRPVNPSISVPEKIYQYIVTEHYLDVNGNELISDQVSASYVDEGKDLQINVPSDKKDGYNFKMLQYLYTNKKNEAVRESLRTGSVTINPYGNIAVDIYYVQKQMYTVKVVDEYYDTNGTTLLKSAARKTDILEENTSYSYQALDTAGYEVIGEKTISGKAVSDQKVTFKYKKILVKVAVEKVTLNKTELKLNKGKTDTLKATVTPDTATNRSVQWKSSNTKVATVSDSGVVKAVSAGTAEITALAKDGSGKKAVCKVIVPYSITYKLNKGTNNKSNPDTYYNETVKLKNPSRAGYLFDGWYTDRKYSRKITTIKNTAKKNYTLYAKWKKVTVKTVAVKKATNGKGSKIKISWNKLSDISGYEISYSYSKKFEAKKTKKVIVSVKAKSYTTKKLKKRVYYVRMRAYKMDSKGKRIYGKYSKVKAVKVKK